MFDFLEEEGIENPVVVAAMRKVPRDRFVPSEYRDQASENWPLPIGWDQTISQPFVVAYMTQAVEVDSRSRVLEIGTGSGYQTAVLAEIAETVYSIEYVEPLAWRAAQTLAELRYDNVHLRIGNGHLGWPENAPYDAIVVTAAPAEIPPALIEQLAPGGRLILPLGRHDQELVLIEKSEQGVTRRFLIPVRFVPMLGEVGLR